MTGATEQMTGPNIQLLLNAVNGVIVADVKQTTMSEQLSEKMNMFGTVCNERVRAIANKTPTFPTTPNEMIMLIVNKNYSQILIKFLFKMRIFQLLIVCLEHLLLCTLRQNDHATY